MPKIKVFKIAVIIEEGDLHRLDAIEHEGRIWLVPEWIPGPMPGTVSPARIICMPREDLIEGASKYAADLEHVPP
jgi:hypothetical protein